MPFDASPQTNTVADVLRRARALIDSPEKWCKGAMRTEDGRRCIFGAIDDAAGRLAIDESHLFSRATGIRNIAEWNNAPERTHAEVLAAFDRAIALAESDNA